MITEKKFVTLYIWNPDFIWKIIITELVLR